MICPCMLASGQWAMDVHLQILEVAFYCFCLRFLHFPPAFGKSPQCNPKLPQYLTEPNLKVCRLFFPVHLKTLIKGRLRGLSIRHFSSFPLSFVYHFLG